jgi:hypothetical protein
MPRNPEATYQQWTGTIRLTAEFEIEVGPENDAPCPAIAAHLAQQQLRSAFAAAGKCAALSAEARGVLASGSDIEVAATEADNGQEV